MLGPRNASKVTRHPFPAYWWVGSGHETMQPADLLNRTTDLLNSFSDLLNRTADLLYRTVDLLNLTADLLNDPSRIY